jgi:hypothetical protein
MLPSSQPLMDPVPPRVASPYGGDVPSAPPRVASPSGGDSQPGGAPAVDPSPPAAADVPDKANVISLGANVVSPSSAVIALALEFLETALQDHADASTLTSATAALALLESRLHATPTASPSGEPSGTTNPLDDPSDNAPLMNNLLPTGGTPVSPTPMGVALLDSGASITIMDPCYETLLQTFMTRFKRIDKDLELIGCHFETSWNALDTTKSQFQMLTCQVAEDIDVFRGEVTQVKECSADWTKC